MAPTPSFSGATACAVPQQAARLWRPGGRLRQTLKPMRPPLQEDLAWDGPFGYDLSRLCMAGNTRPREDPVGALKSRRTHGTCTGAARPQGGGDHDDQPPRAQPWSGRPAIPGRPPLWGPAMAAIEIGEITGRGADRRHGDSWALTGVGQTRVTPAATALTGRFKSLTRNAFRRGRVASATELCRPAPPWHRCYEGLPNIVSFQRKQRWNP